MAYLYEKEREKVVKAERKRAAARVERAETRAEKKRVAHLERIKSVSREKTAEVRQQLSIARKAAEALALKAEEARLEAMRLKLYTELNDPLIEVICDRVREGLSLRAACRLSHVSFKKVEGWRVEGLSPLAPALIQEFVVKLEEALGENEKMWIDKVKSAATTEVMQVGMGEMIKRGDGRLGVAMLERQHPKDYSPKQIIAVEEPKEEVDLSDMTDEELTIHRAHEKMLEDRAARAAGAKMLSAVNPITAEDAEFEDANSVDSDDEE